MNEKAGRGHEDGEFISSVYETIRPGRIIARITKGDLVADQLTGEMVFHENKKPP